MPHDHVAGRNNVGGSNLVSTIAVSLSAEMLNVFSGPYCKHSVLWQLLQSTVIFVYLFGSPAWMLILKSSRLADYLPHVSPLHLTLFGTLVS